MGDPRGDRPGTGPRLAPERLGRYQLLRKIAVGGMAEIYLARVSGVGGFEKNVVLKRILPQLAESDEFFRMFLDEARIAATLQHPNVIQVYDAGQEGGEYFIAMEYLEGADLLTVQRTLSARELAMPLEHAIHVASSVAAGLHYAHEKSDLDGNPLRIVHRDVTPHNIFLTRDGVVKLVDFGIAKAANRLSSTSYGTLKGKLPYMSPEQCRGESIDHRSDVYSLGIVLYEMATGTRLYRGQSEYLVLKEIVEGVVAPPSQLLPGFPEGLERIMMRTLEKDPARRHQTARELARELTDFARTEQLAATPISITEWLEPVLDDAKQQARERRRQRNSTAPTTGSRRLQTHNQDRGYVSPEFGPAEDEELGTGVDRLLQEIRNATVDGGGSEEAARERPASEAAPAKAERADRWEETPPPELVAPARAPTFEEPFVPGFVEEQNLRKGQTALWLVACLVVAAAAAVWMFVIRAEEEPVEPATGPARPQPVELGVAVVESEPGGAEAWLLLGRAPVESIPVEVGAEHELLVEHEGYAPRRVRIDASSWTVEGEARVARLSVTLLPLDHQAEPPEEGESPEERAGSDQPAGSEQRTGAVGADDGALGRLLVETDPPAAGVWLGAGITPTTFSRMPIDRTYEFRLERSGYAPAFVRIGRSEFGDRRRAHVRTGMKPLE